MNHPTCRGCGDRVEYFGEYCATCLADVPRDIYGDPLHRFGCMCGACPEGCDQ